MKTKGWRHESEKHSLASKGVKTSLDNKSIDKILITTEAWRNGDDGYETKINGVHISVNYDKERNCNVLLLGLNNKKQFLDIITLLPDNIDFQKGFYGTYDLSIFLPTADVSDDHYANADITIRLKELLPPILKYLKRKNKT
jgi:hypothetical protein